MLGRVPQARAKPPAVGDTTQLSADAAVNVSMPPCWLAVAVSILRPISAGQHTIYQLAKRSGGSGYIRLLNPTLTVLIPGERQTLPLVSND